MEFDRSEFTKVITTDKYEILFNSKDGTEITQGINGYDDPFILEYPSLMDIGIMGKCDNKCVYCYQGDKTQDNMKLEHFKRIIDESKDHITQVALGGRGNPNKHENFKEIIEYCVSNGVVPNYTTSGIDLTDEEIEISKLCGAVAVSMHEKDYTWDAIKRFQNSINKTNIHFVLSKKHLKTSFKLLLGQDPWDNKVDFTKLNAIIFLLFKPQGRGKDLNKDEWILSSEEIQMFGKLLLSPEVKIVMRSLRKFNFKVGGDSCLFCKIKKAGVVIPKHVEESIDTCEGARMSCYMTPDMKFLPCSFGDHDLLGESILDNSIKYIWDNGKEFLRFRDSLKNDAAVCPFGL